MNDKEMDNLIIKARTPGAIFNETEAEALGITPPKPKAPPRDFSKEAHEVVMRIYSEFDILLKIIADFRKASEKPIIKYIPGEHPFDIEEERKAKLMSDFDKIKDRNAEEI